MNAGCALLVFTTAMSMKTKALHSFGKTAIKIKLININRRPIYGYLRHSHRLSNVPATISALYGRMVDPQRYLAVFLVHFTSYTGKCPTLGAFYTTGSMVGRDCLPSN